MHPTIAIEKAPDFSRAVLQTSIPVAAVFHATWCPYCRKFLPTFEALANEFAEHVRFVTVDVDKAPNLEVEYKIGKIPTVLLFQHGRETNRWVNEQDIAPYRRAIAALIPEYMI
jgi:thioredoxin 1